MFQREQIIHHHINGSETIYSELLQALIDPQDKLKHNTLKPFKTIIYNISREQPSCIVVHHFCSCIKKLLV